MYFIFFLLQWFACFIATTDYCSSDMNMAVDNAFISCSTNFSCTAKCYRGFIFPSGSTKEYYSCQNGVWTPMLPSCKRALFLFPFFDWVYVHIWLRVPNSFNGLDLHYVILVTLWGHVKACVLCIIKTKV